MRLLRLMELVAYVVVLVVGLFWLVMAIFHVMAPEDTEAQRLRLLDVAMQMQTVR